MEHIGTLQVNLYPFMLSHHIALLRTYVLFLHKNFPSFLSRGIWRSFAIPVLQDEWIKLKINGVVVCWCLAVRSTARENYFDRQIKTSWEI